MHNADLKHSLAPHFANLRTSTVHAMSNMLSANIDSGLMHSIGLGYHEDPQTRATFLEVLTDILKQVGFFYKSFCAYQLLVVNPGSNAQEVKCFKERKGISPHHAHCSPLA